MILRINKNNYRLELGYDFEFFKESYIELLWNVVNCFCDNDEMSLFGYTEYDKDLDSDKEEMANSFLRDFHTYPQHTNFGELTVLVKEILYKHYSELINNTKVNKDKEELLADFRNISLENIHPSLKNKIREFLYSKMFVTELTDEKKEFQEFVKQRISFSTKGWYFPSEYLSHFYEPNNFIRTLWVNLNGKEEGIKWLNKDHWFICTILEKGKPLSEYSYYLTYGEEEPEPTMVLEIVERKKGHFKNIVFPRLQKIFNNQIKIVD